MLIYQNNELTVRELEESDEQLLVNWLSNPVVLQYYGGRDRPHDLDLVRKHFYDGDDERRCIIEYAGKAIGYIQFYTLNDDVKEEFGYENLESNIFGTDQFIGEIDHWNKGIGKKLVTSMVNYLINQENADIVIMDPQSWNERAIACYEKCGFIKVKLLKENEYHEGEYRDCWLMEYKK